MRLFLALPVAQLPQGCGTIGTDSRTPLLPLASALAEFQRTVMATAVGFAMMGFIGFFVKLIHIPINNIIVYVSPAPASRQT